jgi:hypothetical protein
MNLYTLKKNNNITNNFYYNLQDWLIWNTNILYCQIYAYGTMKKLKLFKIRSSKFYSLSLKKKQIKENIWLANHPVYDTYMTFYVYHTTRIRSVAFNVRSFRWPTFYTHIRCRAHRPRAGHPLSFREWCPLPLAPICDACSV